MKCQVCDNTNLTRIIDLGYLPPPNDYLPIGKPRIGQLWMPTELMYCDKCELVQLDYIAKAEWVFPPEYPYTSGTTKLLRDNFKDLAKECCSLLPLKHNDLVVDIGSNDGTLLKAFQDYPVQILGIEPTDIADIAMDKGIRTLKAYFNEATANRILSNKLVDKANLITCANCFAHIADVHDVMRGVKTLLADDGVFVTESHYLVDLLKGVQYDTIYHEHLRYYSMNSLHYILDMHGFEIFHYRTIPTHGGSIRVYAARKGQRQPINIHYGKMNWIEMLKDFASEVIDSRSNLIHLLTELKLDGKTICGISAPSRAATIVNYCRLDSSLIDRIYEIDGSLKIGKYMPGTTIPVVSEASLIDDAPDHAVLFSHHIADELKDKLRAKGFKGDFIIPI